MPITMIHRNGGPYDAITCPAILCDTCGKPINAAHPPCEANEQGLVLWDPRPFAYTDHRPTATHYAYVHKGACDQKYSAGKPHLFSRELDSFMDQLAHNYTHPFEDDQDDIEYVAPAPSTWRLGKRTKTTS